nr:hypothetical protein [Arthrobacter sp. QXT-31]
MLEVNGPKRAARRLRAKSDPLDAYEAAKSVLEGRTTSIPKAKDGPVECLRILRAGRASAMKARTAAINQIKGLLVSAPDKLRAKYRAMATSTLIPALQRTRPSGHTADPEYVTLVTLKALATRRQSLAAEIAAADAALQEISDAYAPMLCDLPGVGTDVASQLLVTAEATRTDWETRPNLLHSLGLPPCRHHQARQPAVDSAGVATAMPTTPSIKDPPSGAIGATRVVSQFRT